MDVFDVWSALAEQAYLNVESPPQLASVSPELLPPLPPYPKPFPSRRYTVKTTPTPAAEVDKQTISSYEENRFNIKHPVYPSSWKPQSSSFHSEDISQEAREALDDIVQMFQAQRTSISVKVCLTLLHEKTQKYIRSRGKQRRLH